MVTSERAKKLLALHGAVRSQSSTDWSGAFTLPPAIERFYSEVGPVDVTFEGYGNPYFLPSLSGLWKFQAGYRWNGLTGDPLADWKDDWLVVADNGGDPFIFSRSSKIVLHDFHGAGRWNPRELFPDLNVMTASLAQLGAVVLEAGGSFTDDESNIRPEWRANGLERLRELLGSTTEAETVLTVLGWSSV